MLIDPDAYSSSSSGGLPSDMGSVLDQVLALPGATFGLGVIDLETGESVTRNGSRRFQIDTPDIVAAAYCISRHNDGIFRLDSLVGRETQLWMKLRNGQQGSREQLVASIYYSGDFQPLWDWLDANFPNTDFINVARDWAGAPTYDPNLTTPSDCLGFMEIVYGSLDQTVVRRMTSNPPLSDNLETTIDNDDIIYGWISSRGSTRSINMIISRSGGGKYGICVLANDLCCEAKADQAFSMIYSALD